MQKSFSNILTQFFSSRKIIFLFIVILVSAVARDLYVKKNPKFKEFPVKLEVIEKIDLPKPNLEGKVSLEETLRKRRSRREFSDEPLSLKEISQLLWAAQGVTSNWGGRTAPSAGGLYPLEMYMMVKNVESLNKGLYHYEPKEHKLSLIIKGDLSESLSEAALGQSWVKDSAVNVVIVGVFERTTQKYGQRGVSYVYQESGHAAQNIYLEVESLNLATVSVGGFNEGKVKEVLDLTDAETPLYIMPIGRRKN